MSQPTIPELRSDIEHAKEGIRANMQELGDKVGNGMEKVQKLRKPVEQIQDWDVYVAKHPLPMFGLAVLAGLVISGVRLPTLFNLARRSGTIAMHASSWTNTLQKLQQLR